MSRATVIARPAGPGPAPPGPVPSARRRAAIQEHAMRLSYRRLRLSIHLDHGAGVAVTGGQRDELVEARADAILAGVQTAAAYAEHFEAQMDRDPARKLLPSVLRMFRRPGGLAGGDPGDVRPARLRRRHRAPGPGGARRRRPADRAARPARRGRRRRVAAGGQPPGRHHRPDRPGHRLGHRAPPRHRRPHLLDHGRQPNLDHAPATTTSGQTAIRSATAWRL
jgi:hypothetical protein